MTNTTLKKGKQCARGKCKELVYTKSPYAKQLGLCKNHFTLYKDKYTFCLHCEKISINKFSRQFCSATCERRYKFIKKDWFKFLNNEISKIYPYLDKIYANFLLIPSSDSFLSLIKDIQLLYSLKHNKNKTDVMPVELLGLYSQFYFLSILDLSLIYYANINGLQYFCIPTTIVAKAEIQSFNLINHLGHLTKGERLNFYEEIDKIFNKHLCKQTNKPEYKVTRKLDQYVWCFSNQKPYKNLPVFKILMYVLPDINITLDMTSIDFKPINIAINKNIKFVKSSMNQLEVELFSLVILYAFAFRRKDILIELIVSFDKFLISRYNERTSIFLFYLRNWFGLITPENDVDKQKCYLNFYQTLFLVYQQKLPKQTT